MHAHEQVIDRTEILDSAGAAPEIYFAAAGLVWSVMARSVQMNASMQGVITSRDVFRHSLTILRLWGPSCYLRCLRAMVTRRSCTFLEVLYKGSGTRLVHNGYTE